MKKLVLVYLLGFAYSGFAQERDIYAGIGGGGTNFESKPFDIELPLAPAEIVTATIDDSDSNLRVYAGYRMNPNLAFEILYSDIGEFEFIDDANRFDATFEASSIDLAVVGLLPLADGRIDLFARAGVAFWSLDAETSAIEGLPVNPVIVARPESSGQDPFWSVGFNLNFFDARRWTFRSELTTYEISDVEELAQFGFNVQYRF